MKKIKENAFWISCFIFFGSAIVFLIYCCIMMFYAAFTTDYIYPLTTVVTQVDKRTDIVCVEDGNGNKWSFFGVEDWQEGDVCSMIMNNQGTKDISDDVIIKQQYGGTFTNEKEFKN